ncbi:MAG: hypothetical protein ABIQ33_07560 [Caldimonas sp.]
MALSTTALVTSAERNDPIVFVTGSVVTALGNGERFITIRS